MFQTSSEDHRWLLTCRTTQQTLHLLPPPPPPPHRHCCCCCCRRFYHINEVISKSLFPLRCNNGLRSGFIQHVHSPVFHFISPGTKLLFLSTLWQTRCVTQTDCERAFVCLTACVLKRQAGLMGFSCKPPTGNSLLYTFPSPACSADTPPSWLACLWARRDPKGLPCF